MTPTISVLTPSYQQARFIPRTIESVLEQGGDDWEHIVIDGGSTDGTVKILREFPTSPVGVRARPRSSGRPQHCDADESR